MAQSIAEVDALKQTEQYRTNVTRLTDLMMQAKEVIFNKDIVMMRKIDSGRRVTFNNTEYAIYLGIIIWLPIHEDTRRLIYIGVYYITGFAYYDNAMKYFPANVTNYNVGIDQANRLFREQDRSYEAININNVVAAVSVQFSLNSFNRIESIDVRTKPPINRFNKIIVANQDFYDAEYKSCQGLGMLLLCLVVNCEQTDFFKQYLSSDSNANLIRAINSRSQNDVENQRVFFIKYFYAQHYPNMLTSDQLTAIGNNARIIAENAKVVAEYFTSKGFVEEPSGNELPAYKINRTKLLYNCTMNNFS